jgi:hypothetical protein
MATDQCCTSKLISSGTSHALRPTRVWVNYAHAYKKTGISTLGKSMGRSRASGHANQITAANCQLAAPRI